VENVNTGNEFDDQIAEKAQIDLYQILLSLLSYGKTAKKRARGFPLGSTAETNPKHNEKREEKWVYVFPVEGGEKGQERSRLVKSGVRLGQKNRRVVPKNRGTGNDEKSQGREN